MKRVLVASILGLAATAVTTYGQGNILFDNYAGNNTTQVKWGSPHPGGVSTGDVVTDTSIIVSLYAGAGTLTDSAALNVLLGTAAIFNTTGYGGGWYDGGSVLIPTTLWTGSQTLTFQVRASGGPPFLNGSSALWQESAAILSTSLPASQMANGPLPLVVTVPEPATLALAGLGAAAMLIFRKRE